MEKALFQKLWEHEIKILDEIDRICKKHNITYFLMWGTLIGAVRHKGFIPWDDDIDISMPYEDYKKFLRIAKKELGEEFFLQTGHTDKYHPVYFAKIRLNNTAFYSKGDTNIKKHHGIFVDIIPLFERNNPPSILTKIKNRIGQRFKTVITNKIDGRKDKYSFLTIIPHHILVCLRDCFLNSKGRLFYSWGHYFEKDDFFPVCELEFCNKNYPAPNKYDKVLRNIYGDYMQLPPPELRVAHNPGRISFDTNGPDEIIE